MWPSQGIHHPPTTYKYQIKAKIWTPLMKSHNMCNDIWCQRWEKLYHIFPFLCGIPALSFIVSLSESGDAYIRWLYRTESRQKYEQKHIRSKYLKSNGKYLYWIYMNSYKIWSFNLISKIYFYRTRVRSLAMLVTHWLTDWLTHSVTFSKLDWCHSGVRRCLLKTCWGCYSCWC